MNNVDISQFINFFIDTFLQIWNWIWDVFKAIQFNGTSLYYIIVIIIVLKIGLPIVLQLHEEGKQNDNKIERSKYNDRRKGRN